MISWTEDIDKAVHELYELRAKLDRQQQYAMSATGDLQLATMTRSVAILAGYATTISPYLYGVLASAHRSEAYATSPEEMEGRVFIDERVVHPVLGGKPVLYGAVLHDSVPWFDMTMAAKEDEIVALWEREIYGSWDDVFA